MGRAHRADEGSCWLDLRGLLLNVDTLLLRKNSRLYRALLIVSRIV